MTLTNQELIQELQKRVKEGTLVAETTVDQFEKTTSSLLSRFSSKELLLLTGLTVLTILAVLYSIKATSTLPTGCTIEFGNPPLTVSLPATSE